jgi:outer membrane protein assembly factor BamB
MGTKLGFFAPARLAGLAVAAAFSACGGGQTRLDLFTTNWSDDGGRSIEEIRQRIGASRAAPGTDVAVGVTAHLDTIVGLPLAGGTPWKFAHPLSSRPIVSTGVVIGSGGGELFALDASTGQKLWARPAGGLELHGAGDDGAVTVVTLSSPTGRGSTLLAVTRDGAVVRQIETEQYLGSPAVLAHLAFVPWLGQYVSVLDLADGGEIGRVVVREPTSRAWTTGGGLYFGESGLIRFDEHIKDASRRMATHLALPARELPGSPKLMPPGDMTLGPGGGALDKVRLYARPTSPPAPLAFDDDRFYATYFKLVMGFTAGKGALAWVHTHSTDIIGGAAADGGVVLCDGNGKVTVLGAKTGGVVSERDFGVPLASCVVQVDAFTPTGVEQNPGSLAAQLQHALENRELELATAQRLLLRELSTLPDEQATLTLVDIASDPRTSPALIGDARAELAARRNGARFMIAALARHYDFLKDVLLPPPVAPIAQALAAMSQKDAAPALASHLMDPADTDDDVKQVALALVLLASPAELPTLKQFFAMYRDAPDDPPEMSDAVVSVGQALINVGAADGRAVVDQALAHRLTNSAAQAKLQAIVEAADAQKPKPGVSKGP